MKPLIQIRTYNRKGQSHGYQEAKIDDSFVYRYKTKNGLEVGYDERHGSRITNLFIR